MPKFGLSINFSYRFLTCALLLLLLGEQVQQRPLLVSAKVQNSNNPSSRNARAASRVSSVAGVTRTKFNKIPVQSDLSPRSPVSSLEENKEAL